jgi:adenylate kinase family enzyme
MELGRRIHVIGTSGSGKTTLARALSGSLGLRHIELDALHWGPSWTEKPEAQLLEDIRAAIATDGWVVDGNYGRAVRELLWPRADTIVWLDLPRELVMRQVIARTWARYWSQAPLWNGNRESLWRTLFTKESIVWWAWSTHAARHAQYEQLLADPPCDVVRVRSREDIRAIIDRAANAAP